MKALAFTISFLLAFLLFAVQPMATKMVLPTLGGTPAVWNTAMLTFQLLLLGGYAYAHMLTRHVPGPRQWLVHTALVAASCLLLPLTVVLPADEALVQAPILPLAFAFLWQIGLPFFVLSATAPLLQSWVSRSNHPLSHTPYVLYSASNLGSMLGLLGYVIAIEPFLTLPEQTEGWSLLYVVGVAGLLLMGARLRPTSAPRNQEVSDDAAPARLRVGLWVWLAFLASALSLGVTSYITTDIAAVPLLWVMPLAIYLLSFVDAFRDRPILVPLAIRIAPMIGIAALLIYAFQGHRFAVTFLLQLLAFAVLAFALHGWLARLKPAAHYLTGFYFAMSIGGALGGVLNALVAPMLFTQTHEYPMALFMASITSFMLMQRLSNASETWHTQCRLLLRVMARVLGMTAALYVLFGLISTEQEAVFSNLHPPTLMMACSLAAFVSLLIYRRYVPAFYAMCTVVLVLLISVTAGTTTMQRLFAKRNFFGLQQVFAQPKKPVHMLMHNTTLHGAQRMKGEGQLEVNSYYFALKQAFIHLPVLKQRPVAVMGLGAGTVKCLLHEKQHMDFFEINPVMVEIAENPDYFTYLSNCPGTHHVMLGDGRITMAQQPDGKYGAIMMDAFSSDAIPTHLLTREALAMYMQKLAPGGVLIVHTTNRHVDLWPLMAAQAKELGLVAYANRFTPSEKQEMAYNNFWVLLARSPADTAPLRDAQKGWHILEPEAGAKPWTDQFINVLPYFRMLRGE